MARSQITRANLDQTSDTGTLLQSLIRGEQLQTNVALGWFTNINGVTLTPRLIEADMTNVSFSNGRAEPYPSTVRSGAQSMQLPICYQFRAASGPGGTVVDGDLRTESANTPYTIALDTGFTSNSFTIIWDDAIGTGWQQAPRPDRPSYAFFELEVRDTGAGDKQQIYKPLRGLIEVRYSVNLMT